MMDWLVEITAQAEKDIMEIYQYIALSLGEAKIAWNQTERIREKINKLNSMPERFSVVDEEPWKSRGIRRVNVDNYAAFYIVDRELGEVRIIRVLYARRDFSSIL